MEDPKIQARINYKAYHPARSPMKASEEGKPQKAGYRRLRE
jgi:hypothetical protein